MISVYAIHIAQLFRFKNWKKKPSERIDDWYPRFRQIIFRITGCPNKFQMVKISKLAKLIEFLFKKLFVKLKWDRHFHYFFAFSLYYEIFCPKLVGIDWNERIKQFSCYRFPFIGIENSAWHCVPKATRNLDRLVRRRELRLGSQFPRKSRMRWNLGEDLPGNKNSRNLWSWRVAATTRRERE